MNARTGPGWRKEVLLYGTLVRGAVGPWWPILPVQWVFLILVFTRADAITRESPVAYGVTVAPLQGILLMTVVAASSWVRGRLEPLRWILPMKRGGLARLHLAASILTWVALNLLVVLVLLEEGAGGVLPGLLMGVLAGTILLDLLILHGTKVGPARTPVAYALAGVVAWGAARSAGHEGVSAANLLAWTLAAGILGFLGFRWADLDEASTRGAFAAPLPAGEGPRPRGRTPAASLWRVAFGPPWAAALCVCAIVGLLLTIGSPGMPSFIRIAAPMWMLGAFSGNGVLVGQGRKRALLLFSLPMDRRKASLLMMIPSGLILSLSALFLHVGAGGIVVSVRASPNVEEVGSDSPELGVVVTSEGEFKSHGLRQHRFASPQDLARRLSSDAQRQWGLAPSPSTLIGDLVPVVRDGTPDPGLLENACESLEVRFTEAARRASRLLGAAFVLWAGILTALNALASARWPYMGCFGSALLWLGNFAGLMTGFVVCLANPFPNPIRSVLLASMIAAWPWIVAVWACVMAWLVTRIVAVWATLDAEELELQGKSFGSG